MRCPQFPVPLARPLLVLTACVLFLAAGCASKTVIQSTPSAPPAQQPVRPPAVTETLLASYESWKGVPHRIGGTDRRGVDCSGLMQAVFREAFALELPRTSREQSRLGKNVPPADMRPGDLVYFIDKRGDHIGVVIERGRFLHASSTIGVTVSEFDAYWWPRLQRVQRVLPETLTSAQAGS